MQDDSVTTLEAEEIERFLGRRGTGVLSLARENHPYAIPVSYGYDGSARDFYLRLGYGDDSEKRSFVRNSAEARLVVYEQTDDTWKSVIAVGSIDELGEDELDIDIVRQLQDAERPLYEIWDEPLADITFELVRLSVNEITGRAARGETPT